MFEDTKFIASDREYQDLAIYPSITTIEDICVSVFSELEWDKIHKTKFQNYHTFKEKNLLLEKGVPEEYNCRHNVKRFRSRKSLGIVRLRELFTTKIKELKNQITTLLSNSHLNISPYENELLLSKTKRELRYVTEDLSRVEKSFKSIAPIPLRNVKIQSLVNTLKVEVYNPSYKMDEVNGSYTKRINSLIWNKEQERYCSLRRITTPLYTFTVILMIISISSLFYFAKTDNTPGIFTFTTLITLSLPSVHLWLPFKNTLMRHWIDYDDITNLTNLLL